MTYNEPATARDWPAPGAAAKTELEPTAVLLCRDPPQGVVTLRQLMSAAVLGIQSCVSFLWLYSGGFMDPCYIMRPVEALHHYPMYLCFKRSFRPKLSPL